MDIKDRLCNFSKSSLVDGLDLICIGVWAIWNDRNSIIHNKLIPPVEMTMCLDF